MIGKFFYYYVAVLIFLSVLAEGHATLCGSCRHSKGQTSHGSKKEGKKKCGKNASSNVEYDNPEILLQSNYPIILPFLPRQINYSPIQHPVGLQNYFSTPTASDNLNYHLPETLENNFQKDYSQNQNNIGYLPNYSEQQGYHQSMQMPYDTPNHHFDHSLADSSLKYQSKADVSSKNPPLKGSLKISSNYPNIEKTINYPQNEKEEKILQDLPDDIHQSDQTKHKSIKILPKLDAASKISSSQSSKKSDKSEKTKLSSKEGDTLKDNYSSSLKSEKLLSNYDTSGEITSNYPRIEDLKKQDNYDTFYPSMSIPQNFEEPYKFLPIHTLLQDNIRVDQNFDIFKQNNPFFNYNPSYEISSFQTPMQKPFEISENYQESTTKPVDKLSNYYTANRNPSSYYPRKSDLIENQQNYDYERNPANNYASAKQLQQHMSLKESSNFQESYNPMDKPVNILTNYDLPNKKPENNVFRHQPVIEHRPSYNTVPNYYSHPVIEPKQIPTQKSNGYQDNYQPIQHQVNSPSRYYAPTDIESNQTPVQKPANDRQDYRFVQNHIHSYVTPKNDLRHAAIQEPVGIKNNYEINNLPNHEVNNEPRLNYHSVQGPIENRRDNYDLNQNTINSPPSFYRNSRIDTNYPVEEAIDVQKNFVPVQNNRIQSPNYYTTPIQEPGNFKQNFNYVQSLENSSPSYYSTSEVKLNNPQEQRLVNVNKNYNEVQTPEPNYYTASQPVSNRPQVQKPHNVQKNYATVKNPVNSAPNYYTAYDTTRSSHSPIQELNNVQQNYINQSPASYYPTSDIKSKHTSTQGSNDVQQIHHTVPNPVNSLPSYYTTFEIGTNHHSTAQISNEAQKNHGSIQTPVNSLPSYYTVSNNRPNHYVIQEPSYVQQNYPANNKLSHSQAQQNYHSVQKSPEYYVAVEAQPNNLPIQSIVGVQQNYVQNSETSSPNYYPNDNLNKQSIKNTPNYYIAIGNQGNYYPIHGPCEIRNNNNQLKNQSEKNIPINYQVNVPVSYSTQGNIARFSDYNHLSGPMNYQAEQGQNQSPDYSKIHLNEKIASTSSTTVKSLIYSPIQEQRYDVLNDMPDRTSENTYEKKSSLGTVINSEKNKTKPLCDGIRNLNIDNGGCKTDGTNTSQLERRNS